MRSADAAAAAADRQHCGVSTLRRSLGLPPSCPDTGVQSDRIPPHAVCFSGDRQIRGHIHGARAGKEQSAPTTVTRQSPDVRGHSRASAARMSPPFWRRGRRGVLQHRRFVSGCCPVVVTVLIRMVCAKVLISEPSVLVCAVYTSLTLSRSKNLSILILNR